MNNASTILSVGIDIGTATTQLVFCNLTIKDSAGSFSVPHIKITDKTIIYKSDIYNTPLINHELIDAEEIRRIVEAEYKKAGFLPKDVSTGAVIITGETARKENAQTVLSELSNFAGDFVVSTAGPDLEAIISGKGSGAVQHSKESHCCVVNLDIGGGTTNAVVFDEGKPIAKGCLDIGGRLIKYEENITYISDSIKVIADSINEKIYIGQKTDFKQIKKITDCMARLLSSWLEGADDEVLDKIITKDSSLLEHKKRINKICFSGGVADCVYNDSTDYSKYNDIGILLGQSIKESRLISDYTLIQGNETIRATVIGAGSYTTTVSGSTIMYNNDVFPMKNIPVLKLSESEESECFDGIKSTLKSRIAWMKNQSSSENIVVAMKGHNDPTYTDVQRLSEVLVDVLDEELEANVPMIVVLECDIAKALGQMMVRLMKNKQRDVICIDSIQVESEDYLDLGKPLMNGMVIPVVVKTLAFSL